MHDMISIDHSQIHMCVAEHCPHIFERLPLLKFQRFEMQQHYLEPQEIPQGYLCNVKSVAINIIRLQCIQIVQSG